MSDQQYIIDRFNARSNVFFQRVKEYKQGNCSKVQLAGILGIVMGTYECLRIPFPKEINEKYRQVCLLNAEHDIY